MTTKELTFLITDLEGSTRLWETAPGEMDGALAMHDERLRAVITQHGGAVFAHTGDGLFAVFDAPLEAVRAAAAAQEAIAACTWPDGIEIAIRVAVHCGEAEVHDGNYFGRPVNATARLAGAAHGGQILLSGDVIERAGLSSGGAPPIDGTSLVDLGIHHLRDLATAIHVHQLSVVGLESSFPPIRTLESTRGNLPRTLGDLVGRAEELARIAELLGSSEVVTLTGFAGVGKTRLALHAAAEASVGFRDGTWVVELAPIGEPSAIEPAIASLLRVRAHPGLSLRESIIADLAPQHALIVLDNCEHHIDAAAEIARAIARGCPFTKVLATSLERFDIPGEAALDIHPLSLDPPDEETAGMSASGRLFCERAVAANPGFVLGPGDRELVEQICSRVDGLPLAIELTAPRVISMSLQTILDRLTDRFRLLSHGRRTDEERHRTLRNVVEWAYSLLTEPAQQLAARLAIFSGSFELAAVEAVCFADDEDPYLAAELLERLVARSIVSQARDTQGPRMRLLQTLQEFGREKLDAEGDGVYEALRQRHMAYYAEVASVAVTGLHGRDEARWAHLLRVEFDNFRAAISSAIAAGAVQAALQLASTMAEDGLWRGHYECADWAAETLALPGADQEELFAHTSALVGLIAGMRGDLPRAITTLGRAIGAEEANHVPKSWLLQLCLGLVASVSGGGEQARAFHARAEELARATRDPATVALTLTQVLNAEANFRDVAEDVAKAEEALWLARELDNPTRIAWALAVESTALRDADPPRARELANEALVVAQRVDNSFVVQTVLTGLALIEARQDGTRESLERLLQVMELWNAAGDWGHLWPFIRATAYLLTEMGPAEESAILIGAERASPWAAAKTEMARAREARCMAALELAFGAERLGELLAVGGRIPRDEVYRIAWNQVKRQMVAAT